jgi:subtilisin family serine protease
MSSLLSGRRRRAAALLAGALCSGLLSTSASAAPTQLPSETADGTVLGASADGVVAGRYIVMLKQGGVRAQSVGASAQALAGGDVIHVFGERMPGFSARLTAAQARRLAADPSVAFVEQDRIIRLTKKQLNPTWGLDRIDQRSRPRSHSYKPTNTGAKVHAYVIDTGIRLTHHQLVGRAESGYDFVDGDTDASDCEGHGTHVAGTIGGTTYGVAKKVTLVSVRVLDCTGEGYLSDTVAGVEWVTDNAIRPAVANMSLGGDYSSSLEYAIRQSIAHGITYVVAAGNEDESACTGSPSGVPAAITVGATDSKDRRAYFSNYGKCVDIFAPGVDVKSSVGDSDTATAVWSGTSMACPHVTGAVAMMLDTHPHYSPAQVRSLLVARSTKGKIKDKGSKSPNRLLYIKKPA